MYTVQDLINDLAGVTHGTNVNKIPNLYGVINRAARAVLLDVNPKETQRIVQLSQVFTDVYDYPIPVDVKGDNIVDLRPQAGRQPWDVFTQGYAQAFDLTKSFNFNDQTYIQWNSGVKSIRIEAATLTAPVVICDTSTITGWTATGGASNISLDTTNNVAGGGALVFDLAAASSPGVIQNSTLTAINLDAQAFIDNEFYWVYLPTGSAITSINLKWGSSLTDYYSSTQTTNQQGTAFVNGWNLMANPWVSATTTGTPDPSLIDTVILTIVYDGTAQTGVKFCNLTSNTGYIFELQYYSKYLFRNNSTGAFVEKIDDNTQNAYLINFDTESYNLLFNKTAYFIAQQLQGADAGYDADYWADEYMASLKRYQHLNPSEAMLKATPYYRIQKKGYGGWANGYWGGGNN